MSDQAEINIQLLPDNSLPIVSIKEDNLTRHKRVTPEDLMTTIGKFHKINTGILPPNTRWFAGSASSFQIIMEIAPKKRDFHLYVPAQADHAYNKGKEYKPEVLQVPFPLLLFYFRVDQVGNKIPNKTLLYALRERVRDDNTALYHFPYGNVYEKGKVCWGSAKASFQINKPMHLLGIMDMFLSSSFNGDLFDNFCIDRSVIDMTDFWTFIRYAATLDVFPEEALVDTGFKFKDIAFIEG